MIGIEEFVRGRINGLGGPPQSRFMLKSFKFA
jgi:hypothetical protein